MHNSGEIHGELSPASITVNEDGEIKLKDQMLKNRADKYYDKITKRGKH